MPQPIFSLRVSSGRVPTKVLSVLTLGLMSVAFSASAAQARLFNRNDYRVCVSQLISEGLAAELSTAACARALHPEDVSGCVEAIDAATEIAPLDALESCARVRRPHDLADCTNAIEANLEGVVPLDALDYCRRSLLPERFAECVLGVDTEVDFTALQTLDTCIDAGYKPTDLAPTFIPFEPTSDLF